MTMSHDVFLLSQRKSCSSERVGEWEEKRKRPFNPNRPPLMVQLPKLPLLFFISLSKSPKSILFFCISSILEHNSFLLPVHEVWSAPLCGTKRAHSPRRSENYSHQLKENKRKRQIKIVVNKKKLHIARHYNTFCEFFGKMQMNSRSKNRAGQVATNE